MNASKEEAREAQKHLDELCVELPNLKEGEPDPHVDFLIEFLAAAERELPAEASYQRSKQPKKARVR